MKYTVEIEGGIVGDIEMEAGDDIRDQIGEPIMVECVNEYGVSHHVGDLIGIIAEKKY